MNVAGKEKIGLRERKKAAQRQTISENALRRFRDQGFEQTTVQQIAADSNISLKTFFNYYATKQAILDECVEGLLAGFGEIIIASQRDTKRGFDLRLAAIVKTMASALEADPTFWRMIFQESKLFNASGSIKSDELKIYDLIADFFRDGQKRGEVDPKADPHQLAEIFISIYYLTSLNWLADWWPKKQRLSFRLNKAITVLLNGIRVS